MHSLNEITLHGSVGTQANRINALNNALLALIDSDARVTMEVLKELRDEISSQLEVKDEDHL